MAEKFGFRGVGFDLHPDNFLRIPAHSIASGSILSENGKIGGCIHCKWIYRLDQNTFLCFYAIVFYASIFFYIPSLWCKCFFMDFLAIFIPLWHSQKLLFKIRKLYKRVRSFVRSFKAVMPPNHIESEEIVHVAR